MKRILCYGDSNTWGLIPGTKDRYAPEVRWTGRLQEMAGRDGIRILEEGLCGRTTMFEDPYRENRNGWRSLSGILDAAGPPDGAVIMLGTNDCKPCYRAGASRIAEGLGKCVDELLKRIPAERILVIAPPVLGESVWKAEYDPEFDRESVRISRRLEQEYAGTARRKRVRLLAVHPRIRTSDRDQEHLTEEGHAALAEMVYGFLKEAFPG